MLKLLFSRLAVLGAALALAACASVKPVPPGSGPTTPDHPPSPQAAAPAAPAPSAAEQRAAAPSELAAERKWLQSIFDGTPVRITQLRDGPVAVDVPREFCFEPGQSGIKPALAAVLDKVSQSLRRLPLARLTLVAAPEDGAGGPAPSALVQQRAAALQKHLQSRGVAAARIGKPTATATAAVQLRLENAAN